MGIRTWGRKALQSNGIHVVRATKPQVLREALALLRPVETEHELIRLGSDKDAGYLVPADLDGIVGVMSPGVSDTWAFEDALVAITNAQVAMIESGEIPNNCPYAVTHGRLGGFTGFGRVGVNDWLNDCLPINGDSVLQMDIEGSEYEVIAGITQGNLTRFRIILIEFHHLSRLGDSHWFSDVFRPVIEKLATDFVPVHAHANNVGGWRTVSDVRVPELLEMTYLRRDRVQFMHGPARLPHPLDQDNFTGLVSMETRLLWEN